MTSQLVVIGAIFVLLASVFAFLIDSGARQSAAPSSEPVAGDAEPAVPPASPEQQASPSEPNRANCNQIRGTEYLSATERDWYLANCS